jgi:hypothetical protein
VHILKRSLFLHGSAHLQTLISHFLPPRVRASFCPWKISISLQLLSVSASLQTSVCIRLFSVLLSVSLSLTRHLNVFFNSDSLQNSFPLCLYVSPHPLPPPLCGNYFFSDLSPPATQMDDRKGFKQSKRALQMKSILRVDTSCP